MASSGGVVLSPGERLKNARKRMGLTQVELSKASGVSQATISQIENGSSPGSETVWLRLARALRVPPEELDISSSSLVGEAKCLPVFDKIPSGPIADAAKSSRETMVVTPDQYGANRYVLRVRGGGMYPRIHDGDHVLVESWDILLPRRNGKRKWLEIRSLRDMNGRIVIARLNRVPVIKKLEVKHDHGGTCRIVLTSCNPDVPPRVVKEKDELRILGRVLEIWARC